jgi:hypothetical protein
MRLNIILVVISALLAALAAFGIFAVNDGDAYRYLITIGSGLSFFITLGGTLAFSTQHRGTALNVRVASLLFFVLLLAGHIVFSFTGVRFAPYIIVTGVFVVLHFLVCYLIIKRTR